MNPKAIATFRENEEKDWERKKRLRIKVNVTRKLCEWATIRANEIRNERN